MDDGFDKCCLCGRPMELVKTYTFDDGDMTFEFVCWKCNVGEVKLKRKEEFKKRVSDDDKKIYSILS